jgi:hypothetical protein
VISLTPVRCFTGNADYGNSGVNRERYRLPVFLSLFLKNTRDFKGISREIFTFPGYLNTAGDPRKLVSAWQSPLAYS